MGKKSYMLFSPFVVEVVPMECVRFLKKELQDKNISMNRELLRLNYLKELKADERFYFTQTGKFISIWIFKSKKLLCFPEGYLLSKKLVDGLHIFSVSNKEKLLITKDGGVMVEKVKGFFSTKELELLCFSYGVKVYRYYEPEYLSLVKSSKESISFKDVALLVKERLNLSKVYEQNGDAIYRVMLGIAVGLFLYVEFQHYVGVEKYEEISQIYKELSTKERETKKQIQSIELLTSKMVSMQKMLDKDDALKAYIDIANIIDVKKERFKGVSIDKNRFRIRVQTENGIGLVEKLQNIKKFKNIRIISSTKKETLIEGDVDEL